MWEVPATANRLWPAWEHVLCLQRHGRHRTRQRPFGLRHRASLQGKGGDKTSATQLTLETIVYKHLNASGDAAVHCYSVMYPQLLFGDRRSVLLCLLGSCRCYESRPRGAGGGSDLPQSGCPPFSPCENIMVSFSQTHPILRPPGATCKKHEGLIRSRIAHCLPICEILKDGVMETRHIVDSLRRSLDMFAGVDPCQLVWCTSVT